MEKITLHQTINTLREEKASINSELSRLPAEQWLSKRGRELANREQELHITLGVLQRVVEGK